MTREDAIEVARRCARENPRSYYGEPLTKSLDPPEWVVDAILAAGAASALVNLKCGHCGQSFGERPRLEVSPELAEHIKACGKNPLVQELVQVKAEREQLLVENHMLQRKLAETREGLGMREP